MKASQRVFEHAHMLRRNIVVSLGRAKVVRRGIQRRPLVQSSRSAQRPDPGVADGEGLMP